MKKSKLIQIIKEEIKKIINETFKIGQYVEKQENISNGHKSISAGFIYLISSDKKFIKLKDKYGNKNDKIFDVKGFKVKNYE